MQFYEKRTKMLIWHIWCEKMTLILNFNSGLKITTRIMYPLTFNFNYQLEDSYKLNRVQHYVCIYRKKKKVSSGMSEKIKWGCNNSYMQVCYNNLKRLLPRLLEKCRVQRFIWHLIPSQFLQRKAEMDLELLVVNGLQW